MITEKDLEKINPEDREQAKAIIEIARKMTEEERQKMARVMNRILESDDLDFKTAYEALEAANSRA